jgi:hypothetical protein
VQQKRCRRNKKDALNRLVTGGTNFESTGASTERYGTSGCCGKLPVVVVDQRKALFDTGLKESQKTRIFQIRAGLIVGEVAALQRPGRMDGASFAQTVIGEQDAAAVLSGFKGVLIFQKLHSDFAIADAEVEGHAIDIIVPEQQAGAG